MEHRWGKRVPTEVQVQIFAHPASNGWGRLRDISSSGGFIETELKTPALSRVRITVPGSGHAAARIARAVVIRGDAQGIGVEWFEADCDVIAALVQEAARYLVSRRFAGDRREMRL